MSNPTAPPPYSEAMGPGYPPQAGYPPQGGYPPQQGGYPPPPGGKFQGYPPQGGQVYNDPAYAPGTAPPVGYGMYFYCGFCLVILFFKCSLLT